MPHERLGSVHAAVDRGKASRSVARVLERREKTTLVEVQILTGRPHQVRIHLAWAGHPLWGDPLYVPGGVPRADSPGLPGDGGYLLHAILTMKYTFDIKPDGSFLRIEYIQDVDGAWLAERLRTFVRDPAQWSQLTILFGLLVLYLANMPTLRLEFAASGWFLFIPFLNLCAVSLILATFTCRFVFPLVSLEGHQMWLLGVLPVVPCSGCPWIPTGIRAACAWNSSADPRFGGCPRFSDNPGTGAVACSRCAVSPNGPTGPPHHRVRRPARGPQGRHHQRQDQGCRLHGRQRLQTVI